MKFNILTLILLAAFVGIISSNAQDRNRSSSREDARKAWTERIKKYQEDRAKAAQGRSSQNRQPSSRERSGSRGQANPLDPEAVKRRLDYGVKEGLLTREQADKLMAEAKKRMEVAGRENNERRERSDNNEGRDRKSQTDDRQDQARMGYEARRKRIEEGVRSGKIRREDAAKMLGELRKRMEATKREDGDSRKQTGDIVEVAAGNKSFETLVTAVKAAGLVDTLKGKGPYTVFAPTDAAFAKLPKGTLQSLLKPENKKRLISILTYHVVPGRVLAKDVKSGRVKTANGSSFEIKLSRGGVTVNNAKVVATDVMASNGVIHVIDTVIIPQSNPPSRSSQRASSQSRSTSRGYLGVSVESSTRPKGLRVQQVYANTAAARAKIKKGDIILKINGSAVTSNSSLIGRLSKTEPGQKATLLVSSEGKTKTVQVQLGRPYSTRSSAQSSSSKSGNSQSKSSSQSRTPQRSSGTDWRKAIEERMKKAREDRERAERNSRDRDNDRGRSDRGEDMRKAWEERIKQAREARERAEKNSRSRTPQRSSGTDWRKAIEERMKKAREDRERAERNSRDRDNDRGRSDRGEDMRKVWEERIKNYQAERAKAAQSRGSSRSSQGRGNSRSSQQRRPSGDDIRKAIAERMKQFAESRKKMSPQHGGDRRPQGHGPQHGGDRRPQGHGQQRGGDRRPQGHGPQRGGDRRPQGHSQQRGGDRRPQGHGPQRGGDRGPQRGGPRGR